MKTDSSKIAVVSIMPCTAKKYEISRDELGVETEREVDAVLTIRELTKMIKRKGLNFKKLEPFTKVSPIAELIQSNDLTRAYESELVNVLNVMSQKLDKKPLDKLKFKIIRGDELKVSIGSIKESSVSIGGHKMNVAIVQGGAAMKEMFERMKVSKKKYHFIELVGCPGGCANGGGMPINVDLPMHEVIKKRIEVLYNQSNEELPLRDATKNAAVLKAYEEFLTKPEEVNKYCHTHFTQKEYRNE